MAMLLPLLLFLHQIQSAAEKIHFRAVRPSSEWLSLCGLLVAKDHAVVFVTNRFCSSLMLHSTYPIVRPRCTTVPSAVSCACHTGRKKLIFNTTLSSSCAVLQPYTTYSQVCP